MIFAIQWITIYLLEASAGKWTSCDTLDIRSVVRTADYANKVLDGSIDNPNLKA